MCLKLKSTGEILVVKGRGRVLRKKAPILRKGIKRTERDRVEIEVSIPIQNASARAPLSPNYPRSKI